MEPDSDNNDAEIAPSKKSRKAPSEHLINSSYG